MMRTSVSFLTFILLVMTFRVFPQSGPGIHLLVRGDDIGSSHAANVACIESYRNGIMKSVELMVPGPWFPEAVSMLKENPDLDVGVHLVVTSEWSNIKWRPLTYCPSLVDKDGYFYPMIWPNTNFPKGSALKEAQWKLEEIEKEFRAQIELARKYIPWISHVNCHMGCEGCAPEIGELVKRLAVEYVLDIDPGAQGFQYKPWWSRSDTTAEQRVAATLNTLKNLSPGKYFFIEHPGLDTPEMQAIGHKGYEGVAADREAVTKVYTSPEIKELIRSMNIRLVSYKDIAAAH
jgi:chitin disaccharide deacetylase